MKNRVAHYLLPCALVLCVGLLLTGCNGENGTPPDAADAPEPDYEDPIPFTKHGELDVLDNGSTRASFDIEIAETDSARERGLMERESLPEDSGMLFIFDDEQERSFWMANTPLSLDIIFINADQEIVSMEKYARPYSPDQVPSEEPAQYVLEVQAGYADSHGILVGDQIRWERTNDES